MDKTIKQELEVLIKDGESFNGKFTEVKNYFIYYTLPDETLYKNWLAEISFWTKKNYFSEYDNIESLLKSISINKSPSLHDTLLSQLKAMSKYPEREDIYTLKTDNKEKTSENIINIHNNLNQSQKQEQSQSQKVLQEVFLEAIKHELDEDQIDEIKDLIKNCNKDIKGSKRKLLDKLSSFGTNVLAGVVGNILTNPAMIGLF